MQAGLIRPGQVWSSSATGLRLDDKADARDLSRLFVKATNRYPGCRLVILHQSGKRSAFR